MINTIPLEINMSGPTARTDNRLERAEDGGGVLKVPEVVPKYLLTTLFTEVSHLIHLHKESQTSLIHLFRLRRVRRHRPQLSPLPIILRS